MELKHACQGLSATIILFLEHGSLPVGAYFRDGEEPISDVATTQCPGRLIVRGDPTLKEAQLVGLFTEF